VTHTLINMGVKNVWICVIKNFFQKFFQSRILISNCGKSIKILFFRSNIILDLIALLLNFFADAIIGQDAQQCFHIFNSVV